MDKETRLRELIRKHLDQCCPTSLSTLYKYLQDGGRDNAEEMIYRICSRDGISVQAAMAQLDSDLDNR